MQNSKNDRNTEPRLIGDIIAQMFPEMRQNVQALIEDFELVPDSIAPNAIPIAV